MHLCSHSDSIQLKMISYMQKCYDLSANLIIQTLPIYYGSFLKSYTLFTQTYFYSKPLMCITFLLTRWLKCSCVDILLNNDYSSQSLTRIIVNWVSDQTKFERSAQLTLANAEKNIFLSFKLSVFAAKFPLYVCKKCEWMNNIEQFILEIIQLLNKAVRRQM